MGNSVIFSRVMEEYGSQEHDKDNDDEKLKDKEVEEVENKIGKKGGLIQAEERLTGSVSSQVYVKYLRYAGGVFWAPVIALMLTGYQGAQVANNLFLGFWTSQSIHGFGSADYMGTYAALGVAIAVFSFALSFTIRSACMPIEPLRNAHHLDSLTTLSAGLRMFRASLSAVLRSAVAFFDTTPMGMRDLPD